MGSCTFVGSHPIAGVRVCSAVAPSEVHVQRSVIPVLIHLLSSGDVTSEMNRFTRVIGSRNSVNEVTGVEKLDSERAKEESRELFTDGGPLWRPK